MSDPQLEPVDWAGVKAAASGPRHYEGSEAKARPVWRCPACGADQQGLLEEGCTECHSGGGAKHVGVPPTAMKTLTITPAILQRYDDEAHHAIASDACMAAFMTWYETRKPPNAATALLAFTAGWHAHGDVTMPQQISSPAEVPTVVAVPEELEGTIQSRTLIAALTFFADQVLKQQPEETVNGEWLQADQINQLIEDVKAKYV